MSRSVHWPNQPYGSYPGGYSLVTGGGTANSYNRGGWGGPSKLTGTGFFGLGAPNTGREGGYQGTVYGSNEAARQARMRGAYAAHPNQRGWSRRRRHKNKKLTKCRRTRRNGRR